MEDENETSLDETGNPREYKDAWREEAGERDDERWSRTNQLKDWILLMCLVILQAGCVLIVILMEPDIR